MLGGLLCIMAVINSMPLRIVAKIAYVGAAWHIIGERLTLTIGISVFSATMFQDTSLCYKLFYVLA